MDDHVNVLRLFLVVFELFQQLFSIIGCFDTDQHAHRLHVFLLAVNWRVRNTTQGGLGTQLSETLLLPCRLVGMLFVREMFRRMLPVNTHSTTLDVSDQWHIQEGLILCMKSASVITKIHRKCCKSTSFRINKE